MAADAAGPSTPPTTRKVNTGRNWARSRERPGSRQRNSIATSRISTVLLRLRMAANQLESPVIRLAPRLPASPQPSHQGQRRGAVFSSASSTTALAIQIEAIRPDSRVSSIPAQAAANTPAVIQSAGTRGWRLASPANPGMAIP